MGIGKISYIKRVIALEGEHLYISEKGEVYIDDKKLEETYLTEDTTPRIGNVYDIVVPKGYVFVMGDNRDESKDSRTFGAIPLKKVEGKVGIRVWPLNKMGAI
jgi:signal peptidase I